VINGHRIDTNVAEAAAVSPAVALQLSVDACSRSFTIMDSRITGGSLPEFGRLLSGGVIPEPSNLGYLCEKLENPSLEQKVLHPPDGGNDSTDSISLFSVDALDGLLSDGIVQIESEDWLLLRLFELGRDYFPLLRHIHWNMVSQQTLADVLRTHGTAMETESLWESFRGFFPQFLGFPGSIDSRIISTLPGIFTEFHGKHFTLLWRGTRDGFKASRFHDRCDGHINTLTLIRDTKSNIFGGFTPLSWYSPDWRDGIDMVQDPSHQTFLFSLVNPHCLGPRKFYLSSKKGKRAIGCCRSWGPYFRQLSLEHGELYRFDWTLLSQ
jgi:hypothetical protein